MKRDLFSSYSHEEKRKGIRKTRLELSYLDKNFLLFTTCKINFYLFF